MSRFSRVNAIWKKELIDTLRDRRTMIAMVVVPIVLYPGMILGSLLAFDAKLTQVLHEEYHVAVDNRQAQIWLRRVLDTDLARRADHDTVAAEDLKDAVESAAGEASEQTIPSSEQESRTARARASARQRPPEYRIHVVDDVEDVEAAVRDDRMHVGIVLSGRLPTPDNSLAVEVSLIVKSKEIRSEIAAAGLEAVLERAAAHLVKQRLARSGLNEQFVSPIRIAPRDVATQQEIEGWFAGLLIPPILIILTITGTIYPAIDLTAGERERGTLETLMVAPVPSVDLIAGKFIVVTLIGILSAALNLFSFAATIYFGGLSHALTAGWKLSIPITTMPWILLMLLPLAVMFGAILLAVSSFARSFKEAQNYVMPVILAAILPAMMAAFPGTRLEGANLIIPVANIALLIRELFMGHFQFEWLIWVMLSTSLYAAAAVAVAAKLFGQEAVLFADSASIRTMLQRKFFKPKLVPTASQALLIVAIAYPLNFFVQTALNGAEGIAGTINFLYAFGIWVAVLFVLLPLAASWYTRVNAYTALALRPPPLMAVAAGLCFGLSTWILAKWWLAQQQAFMPNPEMVRALSEAFGFLEEVHPAVIILFFAVIPAICEELFFRGFALSGTRKALGGVGAVVLVAASFALFHGSVDRLALTAVLGVVLGTLVVRWGSIWPAIIVHMLHNGLVVSSDMIQPFRNWLLSMDWHTPDIPGAAEVLLPSTAWLAFAVVLFAGGLLLCVFGARRPERGAASAVAAETASATLS